jgi:hypothetical protein
MEIETLLNAHEESARRLRHFEEWGHPRDVEKSERQTGVFRKGIIRRFERLRRKLDCKLMGQALQGKAFEQAWDETFLDQHRKDLIYKGNE